MSFLRGPAVSSYGSGQQRPITGDVKRTLNFPVSPYDDNPLWHEAAHYEHIFCFPQDLGIEPNIAFGVVGVAPSFAEVMMEAFGVEVDGRTYRGAFPPYYPTLFCYVSPWLDRGVGAEPSLARLSLNN